MSSSVNGDAGRLPEQICMTCSISIFSKIQKNEIEYFGVKESCDIEESLIL